MNSDGTKRENTTLIYLKIWVIIEKNILLHSENSSFKSIKNNKQKEFIRNHTILYRHPNPNKRLEEKYYVENRIYIDHKSSFDERIYSWNWHLNDKRKIKRIKKGRRTR